MEFTKTYLNDISVTMEGKVYNHRTQKFLHVTDKGYFFYHNKHRSLPKILLLTYKGHTYNSGHINFKDGNRKNYNICNIDYVKNRHTYKQPAKSEMKAVLRRYVGLKTKIEIDDALNYRNQLYATLQTRKFFEKYKDYDFINIFKNYFTLDICIPMSSLAKYHNISLQKIREIIYFFLHRLIEDCKEEGII